MKEGAINLYSDTQTRPSAAMRQCMANAEVGDEQHGVDPTVNRLCEVVAELLGKERAVFLPSGTMCNELSILVHCRAGDEIYAHHTSHIMNFEGGGPAALAGASINPLPGERGMYTPQVLARTIRRPHRYAPRPRLVALEQTANMGGGAVWPLAVVQEIAAVAQEHKLALHMDGARLMNASVAAAVPAREFAAPFDSCWIDLSKGLGCPMGGVLAGSDEFIEQVWWWKQRIGGALRQAGIVAAAGLYALEHHVDRLAQDHANALRFAERVDGVNGLNVLYKPLESNLVFMDVSATGHSALALSSALERQGINIGAMDERIMRAVTHLDVSSEQVEQAASALLTLLDAPPA